MKQNNATAVNRTLLDDAIETEHAEKVVTIKSIENAGGTDGQSIVDRYALVKQNLTALQLEVTKLKNELQEIEVEAIDFAQDNRASMLYGKEFILYVTEEETIQYPSSTDPGRKELETLVRQTGIWESVTVMHLAKLQKYLRNNMFNKKLMDVFSRIATRVKKTKISLIPRVDRY
jgi:hypothetical protein